MDFTIEQVFKRVNSVHKGKSMFGAKLRSSQKESVWPSVCLEIQTEMQELDLILNRLGLPNHDFQRDRSYPYNEYDSTPNPKTCFSKDYADYHVFPYVLPSIQSLILFARKNRVFQCRYCTFNALDYIVEYLYNNNPRFPERAQNPVPLYDIPFAKDWLEKYPRKPFPKWLTMTEEEAVRILQRAIRGYLVRKREDVQEMRQFWRAYQKDMEDEESNETKEVLPIYSPMYDSGILGEEENLEDTALTTHSDTCFVCQRFREFLQRQEMYRLRQRQSSDSSTNEDNDDAIPNPTETHKLK